MNTSSNGHPNLNEDTGLALSLRLEVDKNTQQPGISPAAHMDVDEPDLHASKKPDKVDSSKMNNSNAQKKPASDLSITNETEQSQTRNQSQDQNQNRVKQEKDERGNKKLINLLRGWPSPHLLPSDLLKTGSQKVLSSSSIFVPALQYGPDPGYQPLREELAAWLDRAYHPSLKTSPSQICITGGASQSIANILASFTDPSYTRAVWLVAPCYFLACPIFQDAGFGKEGRLRAVPEDGEGIDLQSLERGLREFDQGDEDRPVSIFRPISPLRGSVWTTEVFATIRPDTLHFLL